VVFDDELIGYAALQSDVLYTIHLRFMNNKFMLCYIQLKNNISY